jgi:hypothetical protein
MLKISEDVAPMPLTETDWRASHNTIANHNQGNAWKWLLPMLAVGGTAGVMRGMYDNRQKSRQATNLSDTLAYPQPQVPLGLLGKSASFGGLLSGEYAHGSYGPLQVPWFPAAAAAALYGGHQLGKWGTKAIGNSNLQADTAEELENEKKKYLNAVRNPTVSPEQIKVAMDKSAEDWSPGTFSMDRWGPELGLGLGAVGGLSMAHMLTSYDKAKMKAQQESEKTRQAQLDAELGAIKPSLPARLNQPVVFNA